MQRLEVSGAVRPLHWLLGVKELTLWSFSSTPPHVFKATAVIGQASQACSRLPTRDDVGGGFANAVLQFVDALRRVAGTVRFRQSATATRVLKTSDPPCPHKTPGNSKCNSQTKHQLDATLCRFYFCKFTLHVLGASAHHQKK